MLILDILKGLTRARRRWKSAVTEWNYQTEKVMERHKTATHSFHPFHRHSSTSTLYERTNDYIASEQEKRNLAGACVPPHFSSDFRVHSPPTCDQVHRNYKTHFSVSPF